MTDRTGVEKEMLRRAYLRGLRDSMDDGDCCEQDFAFKPDGFEAEYRQGWQDGRNSRSNTGVK